MTNIKSISNDLVNIAKELFKENLIYIFLVGSAGKDKFIEGFSDLDFFIILNNNDKEKSELLKFKMSNYSIHIGISFTYINEINSFSLKPRCLLYLYEINNNSNKILFKNKNANYNLPKIDPGILYDVDNEIQRTLKKINNSTQNDFRTIYKNGLLLKKLLLRKNKIILYDPADIEKEFNKIYKINIFNLIDLSSHIKNSDIVNIDKISSELFNLINTLNEHNVI